MSAPPNVSQNIPSSILIIGSGVFGLSTAYSLAKNPQFKDTSITIVDRSTFPTSDASSIDSSRIIRPDYANPAYAALAAEAHAEWRGAWGANGRYQECGLCLTAEKGAEIYVLSSLENMQNLERSGVLPKSSIQVLNEEEEIRAVTGTGGSVGSTGYLNRSSGWADAEASMEYLYGKIKALDRVSFVTGAVKRLLLSPVRATVSGAILSTGEHLTADLTVLAAGAWSPSLLDLRGICSATGQVLAYIPIDTKIQKRLRDIPIQLSFSTGMFFIPPHPKKHHLKLARHGYGYTNPVSIPHPENSPLDGEMIAVSQPYTHVTDPLLRIPAEGEATCRDALTQMIPELATTPFTETKLCWYTDTPTGDFLITYHPTYSGLFVATGGSGHGFKFLPVIGDKIVDCILGNLPEQFKEKWAWPKERLDEGTWTGDGSRGGRKGMMLAEEMAKGRKETKL